MKTKALGDFYLWDRCYIQELDADVSTPTFNLSELKPYIPFKDGNYETCKKFDALTNETIGCEQFVYDGTYYKESRVISVIYRIVHNVIIVLNMTPSKKTVELGL